MCRKRRLTVNQRAYYNARHMDWELNKEHMDQIIYAMENQEHTFFLDTDTGNVVPKENFDSQATGSRYHELPLWRSLEGFQLMERFVGGIRNPIFREELREALSSGSSVFRHFKDALKNRKELETLWFSFKEKEMVKIVCEWLSEIKEIEGLKNLILPLEEEETDELIQSDFSMTDDFRRHLESIKALDLQVFIEAYPSVDEGSVRRHYEEIRGRAPDPGDRESLVVAVETPGGDFAGFAWGILKTDPLIHDSAMELQQLAVTAEYQGLGLGQALLKKFIEKADLTNTSKVRIALSGRLLGVAKLFEMRGFKITAQTLELDMADWERDESY